MAAAATLALVLAPAAFARDFLVTTTQDGPTGQSCDDGTCTLREAVLFAQSGDTITLPAGHYVLTLGELVLLGDTIDGAGARSTIIDGNQSSRVLRITGIAGAAPPTSTVTDVTIRGGNGVTGPSGPNGIGGGIYVQTASLQLSDTHVVANTATSLGGGIGIQGNNSLVMVGSTVAGNTVSGRSVEGGGIGVTGESAGIALVNSTISGNRAIAEIGISTGGGIFTGLTPRLLLSHVTIAGNQATVGGGLAMNGPDDANFASQMSNSLIVANTPTACDQALTGVATHHNLVQDSTCVLGGATDIQGVNAPLLDLTNNGGLTDTRALPAGSPAINAGGTCHAVDQRRIARPPALRHRRLRVRRAHAHGDHERGQRQRRHDDLDELSRHAERRGDGREPRVRLRHVHARARHLQRLELTARLHRHVRRRLLADGRRHAGREPGEDLHDRGQRQRGGRRTAAPAARDPGDG